MNQYFSKQPSRPPLKAIPHLKQPQKILRLQYPHNSISRMDSTITKAINLEYIDLSHNFITKIDPVFGLKRLKYLNLSYNNISQIGQGIINLVSLKQLDLSYNMISKAKDLFQVSELYKFLDGQMNLNIEGNEVLKIDKKAVLQMFENSKMQKTQDNALDISLPFTKQSKSLDCFESSKQSYKSFQSRKKLQYSILLAKPEESSTRRNQSTLVPADKFTNNGSKENATKFPFLFIETLNELEGKFRVFENIGELRNNKKIGELYISLCNSSLNCIDIFKNLVSLCQQTISNTMNNLQLFQEKYDRMIMQIGEIQQLVKDQHMKILERMNSVEEIPVKFYAAWVHTYRRLRQTTNQIVIAIKSAVKGFIRRRELEQISMISPQKLGQISCQMQERQSRDQLQGLLFSKKKKQDQHLDSRKQCEQCLIKNESVKIIQQQLQKLKIECFNQKTRIAELQSETGQLKIRYQYLNKGLKHNQSQILTKLEQIQPCNFQYIMFNQARGIQSLLKAGCSEGICTPEVIETFRNTSKTAGKTDCRTGLTHKPLPSSEKGISQFVYEQNKSPQTNSAVSKKIPYFNQKDDHSSKVSRRQTENSVDSADKRSRSKSHNISYKNSIKQRKRIQEISIKKNQASKKIRGEVDRDNIHQVAQFIACEPTSQELFRESINENQEELIKYSEHNKENIYRENSLSSNYLYVQQKQKYEPIPYVAIPLKEEKCYKKYIKNHLRNSIIEVLSRKSKMPTNDKNIGDRNSIYCSILHPSHQHNKQNGMGKKLIHERRNSERVRERSKSESMIKNSRGGRINRQKSSPKFIY